LGDPLQRGYMRYFSKRYVNSVTLKAITSSWSFAKRKVTSKWIGTIIRKRLGLKTQKSHGIYVIPLSEQPKLERLYEKYGISAKEAEDDAAGIPSDSIVL
jgi:hypothetical protein